MTAKERIRSLLIGIPRFVELLLRLIGDARVSSLDKTALAAAVLYALSPYDLIPDLLPFMGQIDDLFLVAMTIDRLVARAGPELVRAHWRGSEELLETLNLSLADLARRLPGPVVRKLRGDTEAR